MCGKIIPLKGLWLVKTEMMKEERILLNHLETIVDLYCKQDEEGKQWINKQVCNIITVILEEEREKEKQKSKVIPFPLANNNT